MGKMHSRSEKHRTKKAMIKGEIGWKWLTLDIPETDYTLKNIMPQIKAACKKLKPGMIVRNGNTKTVGEVRPDPDNKKRLSLGNWLFVEVKVRNRTGAYIGRQRYTLWRLNHLQIPTGTR